jgi:hypothetical protein
VRAAAAHVAVQVLHDANTCRPLSSATKAVQRATLALERVNDIHGSHGLAARVLGIGDGITDDILQEHLEHAARLLIDEAADALDTTTASQTADCRLGDALDIVSQHLAVALGTTLPQALAALPNARVHGGGGTACAQCTWPWVMLRHTRGVQVLSKG